MGIIMPMTSRVLTRPLNFHFIRWQAKAAMMDAEHGRLSVGKQIHGCAVILRVIPGLEHARICGVYQNLGRLFDLRRRKVTRCNRVADNIRIIDSRNLHHNICEETCHGPAVSAIHSHGCDSCCLDIPAERNQILISGRNLPAVIIEHLLVVIYKLDIRVSRKTI